MIEQSQSAQGAPNAPTSDHSSAPSAGAKDTADTHGTQFQAVDGGGETRSGETLLVEAYTVLWVILMGWLLLLWRKQASLNARLDDLDRVLDKAAANLKAKSKPAAGSTAS
ncbi:hypothetical protein [Pendulispora albinea]|uniref:CcmD family protein n=1 Tax=Pendulispora albinea TaxID=2741071 RepID=A0ABZ2M4L2_9BACT